MGIVDTEHGDEDSGNHRDDNGMPKDHKAPFECVALVTDACQLFYVPFPFNRHSADAAISSHNLVHIKLSDEFLMAVEDF